MAANQQLAVCRLICRICESMARMADPRVRCPECKIPTHVVEDHAAGDSVCQACGLVLEAYNVDTSSEWRTFATNELGSKDPCRVGNRSNHLLKDGGLSTVISTRGARGDNTTESLGRWQHRGNNPDKILLAAFQTIATMADRLQLVTTIKDRANEVYKRVSDITSFRGKSQDVVLAACLYLACRHENNPRTFKEIQSTTNGASVKDIGRVVNQIKKHMKYDKDERVEMAALQPKDYVRRFCSLLGVDKTTVKATLEAVEKLKIIDVRKTPSSLACGAIYMLVTVSGEQKTVKEIAAASSKAESTIKGAYKELYPHAAVIVPEWFLHEHKYTLNNLPAP